MIADMAQLVVLIWSFHRIYQQPSSFYLKAPTLPQVFIFIAVRSLRFDARYVLLAGATAIAGWSLLVPYAADESLGAAGTNAERDAVNSTNLPAVDGELDLKVAYAQKIVHRRQSVGLPHPLSTAGVVSM